MVWLLTFSVEFMVYIIEDSIDLTFILETRLKDNDRDITNIWSPVVLNVMDIIEMTDLEGTLVLYNILPINQYMGYITTECHSRSMGLVLHQKISSPSLSIASDTSSF